MIIKSKKILFNTASVILDDEKIPELIRSGKYSSIVALSYNKLNLPKFSSYTKPTLLIDLSKPEDDILSTFNETTRNEIRKTYKIASLNFLIKESPDRNSYELYKNFEYSQGRAPVSFSALESSMSFEAYLEGKLISCIYVLKSPPYLRIRSIFSKRMEIEDKEAYKIIGYATRRLVWEICQWGKKNGFLSLDMASVNINNPKTESIAKFKMSFGKDLVNEYTYIYKSEAFKLFEQFAGIKLFFKKLFKL